MKIFLIIFPMMVTLLIFSGCQQNANNFDEAAVITAVENVLDQLLAADRSGDLPTVISLYDNEAVLMPPGIAPVEGLQSIEAHYSRLFATFRFVDLSFTKEEVRVSESWAICIGKTQGRVENKTTSETLAIDGKYIMVFGKKGNTWKITRLMWNDNTTF